MAEEKRAFEAEVSKLLHIVASALYTDKQIFLRELISNASDACERLRYLALTAPELTADDPEFRVVVTADAKTRMLSIADNGVGMNREDLIANLGTIARSGTMAFLERVKGGARRIAILGRRGLADRPVRRRLLLGVYGRRQGRRHLAQGGRG